MIIPKVVKFFCYWFLSENIHEATENFISGFLSYNLLEIKNNLIKTLFNNGKPYINDSNMFIQEFNIESITKATNIFPRNNIFDLYYYTDQAGYIFYHIMNIIPYRILQVDFITDELVEKWSDEIMSLLDIEKLYTFIVIEMVNKDRCINRSYISN